MALQRQTYLLLFLMLTAFTGIRLWRLNFPPTVFFDEFVSARHAEAVIFRDVHHGKRLQPSFPHPPLAFLTMAATMGLLHKVFQQKVSLPFLPKSMVYLRFTDSVYFLSHDGSYLAVVSLKDPRQHRLVALKTSLERLVASSYSTLYAIGFTEELIWLDEEGRFLRTIPVPFLPDKISATDSPVHPPIVLISQYQAGQVALFDSHNGEFRWTIHLKGSLNDVAFDTIYGLIYLALTAQKKVVAIDLEGKEVKHWHLNLLPSSVIPIAMPFLIPPKGYKGLSFIYVLDSDRRKVKGFDPTGTFSSIHFNLPTQVTFLAWHPKSPYILVTDGQKVYAINGTTFQIAYTFSAPFKVTDLLLIPDKLLLVGANSNRKEVIFWHLPNHAFALRLPGALLGGLFLPLLCFLLASRVTPKPLFALLAALLVGTDPLLFFLSRIALLDIYISCAVAGAYWFCYQYLTAATNQKRMISAILIGFFLGLGSASKWSAIPAIGGILTLIVLERFGLFYCQFRTSAQRVFVPTAIILSTTIATYLAAYIVYWLQGNSLWDILKWQWKMLHFHASWPHPHKLASRWWQWVLGMKAGLLWHDDIGTKAAWIYLCGAPWLWLPGLVCLGLNAFQAVRTRQVFPTIIVTGFLWQWLPWMFSPRTSFLYHFSSALPFLYLSVAYVLGQALSERETSSWRSRLINFTCQAYPVAAVLTFLWLYPTLTGYPLPSGAGHHLSHWLMGWLPALIG